jgi:HAD superfamily hydrolase (TIGR01490 family)
MKLALFDLDHTLLDGDTNILWIDHLAQCGLVEHDTIERQQHYMALYAREQLDMAEYMDFHIGVLRSRRISEWHPIVENFVHSQLVPRLAPDALATLESHRSAGHRMALVTATNSVLVGALGRVLNIHTISSEVEIEADHATGRTLGLPSFREHKVDRVEGWLGFPLACDTTLESHFYSDSANDIPLLMAVSHPVAVNPDAKLSALAEQNGWPQRSWRATHRHGRHI